MTDRVSNRLTATALAMPAISGAAVAVVLWLADLLRLSGYSFAGVTDAEAAQKVLSVTQPALVSMELKLVALHLLSGALLGVLSVAALQRLAPRATRLQQSLFAAGFTLVVAISALLGMVGRYPQLYSDRWWLGGGFLSALQRTVTHIVGPVVFDGLFLILLGGAIALPALTAARRLVLEPRWTGARKVLIAASLLLVVLVVFLATRSAKAGDGDPGAVNLLILASDSLRTDRIEDPAVMPFTASELDEGTLYRYAFTPIARTYPAWVSTLTGSEPSRHGVRHMFPTLANRRDVGPTLFTELRDRGYFTFAVSDFAGDVFPGFEGGFESLDTPHLNVDTLAQSTALAGHTWSLPFLRLGLVRRLLPFWKDVPSLADPEWVVDGTIHQVEEAGRQPFAGLVFFSTAHFPYVAPYPYYLRDAGDYEGRYLYHVPPVQPDEAPDARDIEQIRARYDGALTSIDRAMSRMVRYLGSRGLDGRTIVVITGDHGEELYEVPGIAGHGDTLSHLRSQAVPIFLKGPGVPAGERSSLQVRHYDLPATVLSLLEPDRTSEGFGQGTNLFETWRERPICLETGIWFWPGRPLGLQGKRLDYPGISELLDLEPKSREMVLRDDVESLVETAKERGLALGDRLYREQLTPNGLVKETVPLVGIESERGSESVDLAALFQKRCVEEDENLRRFYGAVVFERAVDSKGPTTP